MITDTMRNLLSPYLFSWGKAFLSTEYYKNNMENGESGFKVVYALETKLYAGWYMMEMKINFSNFRQKAQIVLQSNQSQETMNVTLQREREKKRLIWVGSSGSKLNIVLNNVIGDSVSVTHFRLVRVTKRFALGRMKKKLLSCHPLYRGGQKIDNAPLQRIWRDYNFLFEEDLSFFSFQDWINEFDKNALLSDNRHQLFHNSPLISVLMPVYNPNDEWLKQAIDSVLAQSYVNWELCIVDDASPNHNIRDLLKSYTQKDDRIKVVFRVKSGHISQASNTALDIATGQWIVLFDQDGLLSNDALLSVVKFLNKYPSCTLFYSDEDKIDTLNNRFDPYFKSDWNLDLFYSQNMFSHLGVFKASLIKKVGGFREGVEGAQDYDLVLRCLELNGECQICHIPKILYHWRVNATSTTYEREIEPYAILAGQKALIEHFKRKNVEVNVSIVEGEFYRISYPIQNNEPLVSIIIPTRNGVYLEECIESILSKTTYSNYEIIIIDNGSDDVDIQRFLERAQKNNDVISVIYDGRAFNYSALNNEAVKRARGAMLALLNDDVVVLSPEWLYEMVSHALRPDVGVVGAKLLYPDNTIQHAGIVLGIHGVAGHVHRFLPENQLGYFGRAKLIQSFSAVTGACLVVEKSIYEQVGGLNEEDLQVACNDVDFCLRVKQIGYRNVWTPYALLRHYESITRGWDDASLEKINRSKKENVYMQNKWGGVLRSDPAYNPNLSLMDENFSLAWPPRDLMKK